MPDWNEPLASRLASLGLSPAREQEVVEELSQHLDDVYLERRAAGASHDDAIEGALDEIDERDLLVREMQPLRQARRMPPAPPPGAAGRNWLADGWQDVAYAMRTLVQARGWTLVIVSLLGIGIGANTALFTATDALLFAPVPTTDPDSLVRFRWSGQNDAVTDRSEYGFNRRTADGKRVGSAFPYVAFHGFLEDTSSRVDVFAGAPAGAARVPGGSD